MSDGWFAGAAERPGDSPAQASTAPANIVTFAAAVCAGLVVVPWHEGAHWVACNALAGRGCRMWYNLGQGSVPGGIPSAIRAAAGPAADCGLAAFATIAAIRCRDDRWRGAMLAVVLIEAFRPIALLGLYVARGDWRTNLSAYDEISVGAELHLPRLAFGTASAAVALVLVVVVVARLAKHRRLLPWLMCGGSGGIVGVLL